MPKPQPYKKVHDDKLTETEKLNWEKDQLERIEKQKEQDRKKNQTNDTKKCSLF